MGIRSRLAGIEVPIIGLDSLKWHQVSLPPSDSTSVSSSSTPIAPLTEDAASCSVIGETYLIWRIHKDLPHALELLELGADKELPRNGLRIIFPDALCPFAFICKDEISSSQGNSYLLHTLTITGVAYILKLRNLSTYIPCYTIQKRDIVEFNLQTYPNFGEITAVGATPECLLVGKSDGSVCCFQLGMLDQSAPGFMHELRDEAGIGRLWGLMSRNRMPGAVQDLVITEVDGRKVVFVLHIDGVLRAWDLSSHCRIFCHTLSAPSLSGATSVKLWVGEEDRDTLMIHSAVLYVHNMELSMETVNIYGLHYRVGDKVNLLPEPSFRTIPLKDGGLIDMKITPNKIWILKEEGVISIDLVSESFNLEEAPYYALQEGYVADQLFQSSEQSLDELLLITQSIFSSAKDQIVPFVSSIFLRRLLNPGVYHDIVLRATLKDYNSHWTDSDFESLTVDGIKKEILSLIAHEVGSESLTSIVYGWKLFCTRYFQHWCKGSASYGLFIESSTGAVCLIRKHSLSLFRCLEDIELLIYGSFQEVDVASPSLGLSDDGVQYDLLFEILQCVNNVSQRLGRAASAICYESLVHETTFPSEDFIPHIVKILETGYSSSLFIPQAAVNSWEKKVADHKAQRIFSVDMLLSLHALCDKATTWSIVLNAIESYLKFLVPRKVFQKFDSEVSFNINTSICVQSTSQISKVMFESAFDIHLLLCYLVSSSAQIYMTHNEISRIQLELIPMIQEIIAEWLIVHYIGTTPSQCTALEDFTTQLSSLQIGGNFDRRSWNEKLGKCNFTLSFVLLLNSKSTSAIERNSSMSLPNPQKCISSVHDFTSWVIWGKGTNGEEPSSSFRHTTELASILLRHGQYDAVEILLTVVDTHSRMEKTSESIQDSDGEWCSLFHLMGCTLLGRAHHGLHGLLKEQKISEAVHCFFRASAGQVVPEALLNLTQEAKSPNCRLVDRESIAAWKLHYYQWVMQIFEQYNISDGACQFALAALEQADEAHLQIDESHGGEVLSESASIIKGRLWANVFKFTLDLNRFYDAYCAIITNPDVESKYVCLRRFLIVLYERGALKILCDGELPFVDLSEKVEQELFWKAGRSDISAKTNPYKLLYAFQMHRHNWRKAASYMYLYSAHLRAEVGTKDHYHQSIFLQERLNALSASINALQLVTPAHAWIDPHLEGSFLFDEHHPPNKRAKTMIEEQPTGNNIPSQRHWIYLDVDKLESEYLLTSAENMLSLANVKWTYSAADKHILELMELLVQTDLYDMAFTVLLKFWKGSRMKSEMERVFQVIALKCIPGKLASSESIGTDFRNNGFMLTSSNNEATLNGSLDTSPSTQKSKRISQWEILELYLDQYKSYHARLPVIVAETLLRMDSQIELPLWLVQMFKNGRSESSWGMTGQESCPAALLRIYVDYGRYTEATNLVLEYIKLFTNVKPGKIIYRKRPFAVWFPYTSIERLWCQLEESISLGHKVEQCDKLKKLLQGALSSYLELVKVDSIDAQSFAGSQNQ